MSSIIKLPFGLDEHNRLIHINDVTNGKKCNCICVNCHAPLIAVKGNIKQHHFRHDADQECSGGLESAIHLAAKRIIIEKKQITLSEYRLSVSEKDSKGKSHLESHAFIEGKTEFFFDEAQEEVSFSQMKVDILATKGDVQLIIEICYRHKVDEQKLLKIKDANISAIEIDLSDLKPQDVKDWEVFWSCINDSRCVKWLHHRLKEKYELQLARQVIESVNREEEIYQKEETIKIKQENKEKAQLLSALQELEGVRNVKYSDCFKEEAQSHPLWKKYSGYLNLKWDEGLPDYLNVEVPDGDWIFGCDRRVWQSAVYSHFIERKNSKCFLIKWVNKWLSDEIHFTIPNSVGVVEAYGKNYPESLPENILNNLPSASNTLRAYFNYLCRLNILVYHNGDCKYRGGGWFMILSKIPQSRYREFGVRIPLL